MVRAVHEKEAPARDVEQSDASKKARQALALGHFRSLLSIATESQLRIRPGSRDLRARPNYGPGRRVRTMDPDELPPQVRAVLRSLAGAVASREPAIQAKVDRLRAT